jgi:hypothetical protein
MIEALGRAHLIEAANQNTLVRELQSVVGRALQSRSTLG